MVNGEINRNPNAIATKREARFLSNVCQKDAGVASKSQETAAAEYSLGSLGTPLTTEMYIYNWP